MGLLIVAGVWRGDVDSDRCLTDGSGLRGKLIHRHPTTFRISSDLSPGSLCGAYVSCDPARRCAGQARQVFSPFHPSLPRLPMTSVRLES